MMRIKMPPWKVSPSDRNELRRASEPLVAFVLGPRFEQAEIEVME
jgi:hypothetical protein